MLSAKSINGENKLQKWLIYCRTENTRLRKVLEAMLTLAFSTIAFASLSWNSLVNSRFVGSTGQTWLAHPSKNNFLKTV